MLSWAFSHKPEVTCLFIPFVFADGIFLSQKNRVTFATRLLLKPKFIKKVFVVFSDHIFVRSDRSVVFAYHPGLFFCHR
jgi:hypothetical protein